MNKIVTIIAAVLFSILFYEQAIGLNFGLFALVTLLVLALHQPIQFKKTTVILQAGLYLSTAVLVFFQSSTLAITTNCICFFTLVGAVSERRSSIYVKWFNGLYSSIAGYFHRSFEAPKKGNPDVPKKEIDYWHLSKMVGIPMLFIILFVLLYKNGNALFGSLVSNISFAFIDFQWLLFTVLGYYLMSNISKPVRIDPGTTMDLETGNELLKKDLISSETQVEKDNSLVKENQLGTTLILLLNLLLLFYCVTDIISIFKISAENASEMSNRVHSGIYALIVSIVVAIGIILYFFRSDLNFYKRNTQLKYLTYLWILLNSVLVVLIFIKNQDYISSFGLTYKRIGVHVYILLTLVGLMTTFIKVLQIKNVAFLFRRNVQAAFVLLLMCSVVNWDKFITEYNLNQAESFDTNYLITLSDRNATTLYNNSLDSRISSSDKNRIEKKYHDYTIEMEQRQWQELNYESITLKTER